MLRQFSSAISDPNISKHWCKSAAAGLYNLVEHILVQKRSLRSFIQSQKDYPTEFGSRGSVTLHFHSQAAPPRSSSLVTGTWQHLSQDKFWHMGAVSTSHSLTKNIQIYTYLYMYTQVLCIYIYIYTYLYVHIFLYYMYIYIYINTCIMYLYAYCPYIHHEIYSLCLGKMLRNPCLCSKNHGFQEMFP